MAGEPLPVTSFGMVEVAAPSAAPVSFLLPAESYDLESSHLRVSDAPAFRPCSEAQVRATYVAPNIAVTPERWVSHNIAPGADTGQAAVISGTWGEGRFIYAGPRLFAELIRQGLPALRRFLAGLLAEVYTPSLWVEAPGMVEATFNRQGDDLVICLVNGGTSRPAVGGFMALDDAPAQLALDEIVPLVDVRVHVRDVDVIGAEDGHGQPLLQSRTEQGAVITLDRLEQFAVIRLQLLEP
jgi:hypothetical protein